MSRAKGTQLDTFTGWSVRFGAMNPRTGVFSDTIMLAPVLNRTLDLIVYAHRNASIRVFDTYRIDALDKHDVGLVYHRFVPASGVAASEFVEGYVGAAAPAAPTPGAAVPAPRGSVDARAAELALARRTRHQFAASQGGSVDDPAEGDPWYDVESAYEFYRARAIARVAGGFDESVWFAGAGAHDDVEARFDAAISSHVGAVGGVLAHVTGPSPANNLPHPAPLLLLALGIHDLPGGADEFEARFITLTRWQTDPIERAWS